MFSVYTDNQNSLCNVQKWTSVFPQSTCTFITETPTWKQALQSYTFLTALRSLMVCLMYRILQFLCKQNSWVHVLYYLLITATTTYCLNLRFPCIWNVWSTPYIKVISLHLSIFTVVLYYPFCYYLLKIRS